MAHPAPARELPQETWSEYLEAISRELLNEPVSIAIAGTPGPPVVQASRLALLALSYDHRGDVFAISAARGGPHLPSVLRHMIEHPEHVWTDSYTMLAPVTIEVDGSDSVRTVITIGDEPALAA